ncbi:MAG: hypothetical protein ACXWQO_05050 [Bdellovibrionota bacterium]
MFSVLTVLFFSSVGWANDGGVPAIKVSEIKMREYQMQNGVEKELRRINNPFFRIFVSGKEAEKLQRTLPSEVSVITTTQPDIAGLFKESFKALTIYSDKSSAATGKALAIACNDADLKFSDDGKAKIIKKSQSECTFTITGIPADADPDYLGALFPYEPGTCR